jgi:translation initiation factor 1
MTDPNSRLVYSTEEVIPRKGKPVDHNAPTPVDPVKCRTTVRLDRKGRGGKSVTVIEGLQLPAGDSEKLLKQLKTKFGTGGAVKNGAFEIQGDHCDGIMAELGKIGYRPKRLGESRSERIASD